MRPENAHQARLLRLLRDGGPQSRAELGEAVELSQSKVAIELDRLPELGFVETDGLAASRGGRRSHVVALASNLRFVGVDIGATSIDVAVTDGELRAPRATSSTPVDVREGPIAVLEQVLDLVGKCAPDGARARGARRRRRRPRAGPPARRRARRPADHAGLERLPGAGRARRRSSARPVMVDNDVNIMALGELHAGIARTVRDFLFVKIGTGIGCGIVVGGEVYRGVTGSAGDIGHIQVEDGARPPVCACGNRGCLEAYFGGAALARDAEAPRGPAARAGSPSGSSTGGGRRHAHRRRRRARPPRPATPSPSP